MTLRHASLRNFSLVQDAEACRQLLEVLVSGSELGIVRGLLLARDCGPCLSMPGVADRLADRLASEEGDCHGMNCAPSLTMKCRGTGAVTVDAEGDGPPCRPAGFRRRWLLRKL